jgi:hypothetical protein
MRDKTNLAHDVAPTRSAEGSPEPSASGEARRKLPNFDFVTPDEESLRFAEEQWLRFCRSIGLEGDVPDIRPVFLARDAQPPRRRRASHWLVRPFVALFDFLNDHP